MNVKKQLNYIGIKIGKFAKILGISRQTLDNYIDLFESNHKLPNSNIENIFNLLFCPPLTSIQDFSERLNSITNRHFDLMQNTKLFNDSFRFFAMNNNHNDKSKNDLLNEDVIIQRTASNFEYNDDMKDYYYLIKTKELIYTLKNYDLDITQRDRYFELYVKNTPYYIVENFFKIFKLKVYLENYLFKDKLLYNNRTKKLLKCADEIMVDIPYEIEEICDNAFANNQFINEVTIPANVRRIGDHAFYNCSSLNKVIFEAKDDNMFNTSDKAISLSVGYRIFELSPVKKIIICDKYYIDRIVFKISDNSKYKDSNNCFFEKGSYLIYAYCGFLNDLTTYDTLFITSNDAKTKLKQYFNCASIKKIIYNYESLTERHMPSIWDFIKTK